MNSAEEIAREVGEILVRKHLSNDVEREGDYRFFALVTRRSSVR